MAKNSDGQYAKFNSQADAPSSGMTYPAGGSAAVNLPGPTVKVPPVRSNQDIQALKKLAQGPVDTK